MTSAVVKKQDLSYVKIKVHVDFFYFAKIEL